MKYTKQHQPTTSSDVAETFENNTGSAHIVNSHTTCSLVVNTTQLPRKNNKQRSQHHLPCTIPGLLSIIFGLTTVWLPWDLKGSKVCFDLHEKS